VPLEKTNFYQKSGKRERGAGSKKQRCEEIRKITKIREKCGGIQRGVKGTGQGV